MQETFREQTLEDIERRFAGYAELARQIAGGRQLGAARQPAFDDACAQLSIDLTRQIVAAFYRDVDVHLGLGFGFLATPWEGLVA